MDAVFASVLVAAIATIPPSIIAYFSYKSSLANKEEIKKAKETASKELELATKATDLKVGEVHVAVNSRMDELLKLAKESSKAEGVLEGKGSASDIHGK